MNIIYLFALYVGIASAKSILHYSLDDASFLFEDFIKTYHKKYDETEKELRYEIFVKNLEKINFLNQRSNHTTFGITKFSDLTSEEFIQKHTGYKSGDLSSECTNSDELVLKSVSAPDEFDWRKKGVVSGVKDQHNCGSCWAFSTTGNVESAYAIKNGNAVLLSEQQLVDCDKLDYGCSGGLPTNAYKYLQDNGAMSENDYPYEGRDDQCKYDANDIVVKLSGCMIIQGSEDELTTKLVNIGPLSVALDGSAISGYTGGIVTGENCQGTIVNHAVLLVGYGTGEDGTPYWLLKNSWGETWGENGYFRIQRGVNCVMLTNVPPTSAIIA